ncbi:hypothetical protein ACJJTC_019507 [Scirpophaga incertulas]
MTGALFQVYRRSPAITRRPWRWLVTTCAESGILNKHLSYLYIFGRRDNTKNRRGTRDARRTPSHLRNQASRGFTTPSLPVTAPLINLIQAGVERDTSVPKVLVNQELA